MTAISPKFTKLLLVFELSIFQASKDHGQLKEKTSQFSNKCSGINKSSVEVKTCKIPIELLNLELLPKKIVKSL